MFNLTPKQPSSPTKIMFVPISPRNPKKISINTLYEADEIFFCVGELWSTLLLQRFFYEMAQRIQKGCKVDNELGSEFTVCKSFVKFLREGTRNGIDVEDLDYFDDEMDFQSPADKFMSRVFNETIPSVINTAKRTEEILFDDLSLSAKHQNKAMKFEEGSFGSFEFIDTWEEFNSDITLLGEGFSTLLEELAESRITGIQNIYKDSPVKNILAHLIKEKHYFELVKYAIWHHIKRTFSDLYYICFCAKSLPNEEFLIAYPLEGNELSQKIIGFYHKKFEESKWPKNVRFVESETTKEEKKQDKPTSLINNLKKISLPEPEQTLFSLSSLLTVELLMQGLEQLTLDQPMRFCSKTNGIENLTSVFLPNEIKLVVDTKNNRLLYFNPSLSTGITTSSHGFFPSSEKRVSGNNKKPRRDTNKAINTTALPQETPPTRLSEKKLTLK